MDKLESKISLSWDQLKAFISALDEFSDISELLKYSSETLVKLTELNFSKLIVFNDLKDEISKIASLKTGQGLYEASYLMPGHEEDLSVPFELFEKSFKASKIVSDKKSKLIVPLLSKNILMGFLVLGHESFSSVENKDLLENILFLSQRLSARIKDLNQFQDLNYKQELEQECASLFRDVCLNQDLAKTFDAVAKKLTEILDLEYCLIFKGNSVVKEYANEAVKNPEVFLNKERDYLFKYSVKSFLQFDVKPEYSLCAFNLDKQKSISVEEERFFKKVALILELFILRAKELEEVNDKVKELQEKNNQLSEMNTLKTELINSVSHELRTPLVSIMGFSNMLRRHEPTEELIHESSEQILCAGQRLSRIVDDFILLNRAESRGWDVNVEPVDISELARFVVDEFSPINKNHSFEMDFPQQPSLVMADGKLLRQVVDNLIINAIKYSPKGGLVKLEIKAHDNFVEFSVRDQGIGMPLEEKDKIFERFYRVKCKETEAIGGMGLGLSICKDIINILNGEIFIDSELGKGSRFTITLPIFNG